jgi:hypothetical protein
LFRCPYKNEHTITHDTLRDIVVAIVLESEHMFRRKSPMTPPNSLRDPNANPIMKNSDNKKELKHIP